jgi:hypothetical protein
MGFEECGVIARPKLKTSLRDEEALPIATKKRLAPS